MIRISHSSCQPALNHSHDHENRALTTDTERLTLTVWHPEEHFKFISANLSHDWSGQSSKILSCHPQKRILSSSLYISYRDLKSVPVTYFQLFNQLLQSIKTDIVKLMLQRNNCIHFWLLMISSSYSDILLICCFSKCIKNLTDCWRTSRPLKPTPSGWTLWWRDVSWG